MFDTCIIWRTQLIYSGRTHGYRQWHHSRQYSFWSLRCSWSIACRRCSNYIFILDLTPGFDILRKDNCKPWWETFRFGIWCFFFSEISPVYTTDVTMIRYHSLVKEMRYINYLSKLMDEILLMIFSSRIKWHDISTMKMCNTNNHCNHLVYL